MKAPTVKYQLINSKPGFPRAHSIEEKKKKSAKLIISQITSLSTIQVKLALKLISIFFYLKKLNQTSSLPISLIIGTYAHLSKINSVIDSIFESCWCVQKITNNDLENLHPQQWQNFINSLLICSQIIFIFYGYGIYNISEFI